MFRGLANKRISEEQGKDPLSNETMKALFTGMTPPAPWNTKEILGVDYVHEVTSHPGFRMVVELRTTNKITGHEFDQKIGTMKLKQEIEAQFLAEEAGNSEAIERANAINTEAGRLFFPVQLAANGILATMHLGRQQHPANPA